MAIIDTTGEFWDDLTISASNTTTTPTGTAVNTLDWGAADLEMGAGQPLYFNAQVGTTEITGTTIEVILDAHTAEDAGGSNEIVLRSGAKTIGSALAPGTWLFRGSLPVDVDTNRYLVVKVIGTGAVAGKVNAWLDLGPQSSFDTQVSTSNIT